MDQLKDIKNLIDLKDNKAKRESAKMVRDMAIKLYQNELNPDIYRLWEAIINIAMVIESKVD